MDGLAWLNSTQLQVFLEVSLRKKDWNKYLEIHFSHPSNRDPVTAGCEQQKLFLELQRERGQHRPEIPAKIKSIK